MTHGSQDLSQNSQNLRVGYLGACFLALILSFSNLQNIFSTLCQQFGFYNLGPTALFLMYASACCSTPFTSIILKKIGFNTAFSLCSLTYIFWQASGFFMIHFPSNNHQIVRIIICLAGSICGFSSSIIWVAQSGYISQTSTPDNKSKLFGLFWSVIVSSQIFGNLIGTFMLGQVNTTAYFCMMTSLGILSFALFTFLPKAPQKEQPQEILPIRQQLNKLWLIITDKKNKYLIIYLLFPGLSMAFYSTYMYKIVKITLPVGIGETIDDYNKRLNLSEGLVFITVGVSQVTTAILYRKYTQNTNKFKLATLGCLMIEIAGFVSFICYLLESYKLCFMAAILWGMSEILMQTNTAVMVSIIFKDKVEGFTISRIFYCIGVTVFILTNLLMSHLSIAIFLTCFLVFTTFGTVVSMNLKYLQNTEKEPTQQIQMNERFLPLKQKRQKTIK